METCASEAAPSTKVVPSRGYSCSAGRLRCGYFWRWESCQRPRPRARFLMIWWSPTMSFLNGYFPRSQHELQVIAGALVRFRQAAHHRLLRADPLGDHVTDEARCSSQHDRHPHRSVDLLARLHLVLRDHGLPIVQRVGDCDAVSGSQSGARMPQSIDAYLAPGSGSNARTSLPQRSRPLPRCTWRMMLGAFCPRPASPRSSTRSRRYQSVLASTPPCPMSSRSRPNHARALNDHSPHFLGEPLKLSSFPKISVDVVPAVRHLAVADLQQASPSLLRPAILVNARGEDREGVLPLVVGRLPPRSRRTPEEKVPSGDRDDGNPDDLQLQLRYHATR